MERRNFKTTVRFNASEEHGIQKTIRELGLDPKRDRSNVVRFGTLFFCGITPELSPKLERYLRQLIKANIKTELIKYLGLEKGLLEKLKKFWTED